MFSPKPNEILMYVLCMYYYYNEGIVIASDVRSGVWRTYVHFITIYHKLQYALQNVDRHK